MSANNTVTCLRSPSSAPRAAQNSLGEWLRRVALGRRLGHRRCGGTGQSRAAAAAKLRGRCVFETTTRTDADEPGAALAAKPAVRRILGSASRTAHPSRCAQAAETLSPHSGALCNQTRHQPPKVPGGSLADPSCESSAIGSPQAVFCLSAVATRRTVMITQPYFKGQKNDFRDAEAIGEAGFAPVSRQVRNSLKAER
jgi:hypothetical protein